MGRLRWGGCQKLSKSSVCSLPGEKASLRGIEMGIGFKLILKDELKDVRRFIVISVRAGKNIPKEKAPTYGCFRGTNSIALDLRVDGTFINRADACKFTQDVVNDSCRVYFVFEPLDKEQPIIGCYYRKNLYNNGMDPDAPTGHAIEFDTCFDVHTLKELSRLLETLREILDK